MQGPGDRRRRSERTSARSQLAEQLLLGDAEALLLVDDDEAEIPRDDVPGQHPVRADEDIDLPLGEACENALHVGRLRKRLIISTVTGRSR